MRPVPPYGSAVDVLGVLADGAIAGESAGGGGVASPESAWRTSTTAMTAAVTAVSVASHHILIALACAAMAPSFGASVRALPPLRLPLHSTPTSITPHRRPNSGTELPLPHADFASADRSPRSWPKGRSRDGSGKERECGFRGMRQGPPVHGQTFPSRPDAGAPTVEAAGDHRPAARTKERDLP